VIGAVLLGIMGALLVIGSYLSATNSAGYD
jgi:hypothetical protein